jgi:hypothetical protein
MSQQSRYSRISGPQAVQSQSRSTGLKNAPQASKTASSKQPPSKNTVSSRNQSMPISQQINTNT